MSWRKCRKVQTFFSSNRKRNQKIDKYGNEGISTVSCKIKFVDSVRFMASSVSDLVDNLTEGIQRLIVFWNTKMLMTI